MKVKKKGERKFPIYRAYKALNYTKNKIKYKVIIYRAYKITNFDEVKAQYTNLWGGVPILKNITALERNTIWFPNHALIQTISSF